MREIETLSELEVVATSARSGTGSMRGWHVQGVDLSGHEHLLDGLDPQGSMFLGATMDEATADRLREGGALLFPAIPDLPFDPWRPHLYTPAELYADLEQGYDATPDARIYAWSRRAHDESVADLLAQAVHDSSIDDALREAIAGQRLVGLMGGHAMSRTDPSYADAAHLAHEIAATGLTVATGGGPGAMEAANLGARLADSDTAALDRAIATLAPAPSFRPDVTAWARAAFEAVDGLPDSGRSLGIPTWYYGHEPPNAFASQVAKYFRNAIREDVLLEVCRAGIVFLPGAAGTVQEVFQAACTNYYAEEADVAPMVFVGEEHWTRTLPAWPLLRALAVDRAMGSRIHLVDSPAEVLALLVEEG